LPSNAKVGFQALDPSQLLGRQTKLLVDYFVKRRLSIRTLENELTEPDSSESSREYQDESGQKASKLRCHGPSSSSVEGANEE